jgi:Na+-transporting NADH:ubiquinone oxidoreductase subunit B
MSEIRKNLSLMKDRFFWSSGRSTITGPHIRDASNVQRVWNYFVIASLPTWLIGTWSLGHQTNLAIADFGLEQAPGWRAGFLSQFGIGFDAFNAFACFMHGLLYFLPIFGLALLVGAFWQALFAKLRQSEPDEGLLVIAWFFALLMPATAPMYQVAVGMTFGIVVGKLIYGGSGRYLFNPALLGVVFLVFSYPTLLYGESPWVPVEGYDQPTVLELVREEGGISVIPAVGYSFWQLFIGDQPGPIGIVSSLGAVLGALFLIWTGVASWRVMAGAMIGLIITAMLFNAIAPDNELFAVPWYWQLVMGGIMFGVVFIATDPVAGPITDPGRWAFGLIVGVLTVLIRVANPAYYEGVLFAILLACVFSPLIDFVATERNIQRRLQRQRGDAGG